MEIKSCPFCGKNKMQVYKGILPDNFCTVNCLTCGACGPLAGNEEAAIGAWNCRGGVV